MSKSHIIKDKNLEGNEINEEFNVIAGQKDTVSLEEEVFIHYE